tara:strand:+ start:3634 stop:3882 length:249 start_codon:yes stop_codon:yes gene_type:complete
MQSIYVHNIIGITTNKFIIPADPDGDHGKVTSNTIRFEDDNNNITEVIYYQMNEPTYSIVIKKLKQKVKKLKSLAPIIAPNE